MMKMNQREMFIASMMNDYSDAADEDDFDIDVDDGLTQQHLPHLPRPQRLHLLVQGLLLPAEAIAPGEAPSESQVLSSSSIRLRAYPMLPEGIWLIPPSPLPLKGVRSSGSHVSPYILDGSNP